MDDYGGGKSLGYEESYERTVGSYLFACCSTGPADVWLYASHEQFPVILHQLRRVEADYYKCAVIYCDTFSVNNSEDAEGACALFDCIPTPVSNRTPQEIAFARSVVRVTKRISTAVMAGVPHLPANSWACADKYTVYLHDFMPLKSRGGHYPFYLRTGKIVFWRILGIHTFEPPTQHVLPDGSIHKRASITEPGWFQGIQRPVAFV